ncbi:MAG TPA: sulfurtransferase [Dokdonella sp.]|nr:sulfurtransferase [Dokdonella sp.]
MILNIAAYLFTPIDDADALAAQLRERADAGALRGTVLVAPEGINLFLAGEPAAVEAFLDALRSDPRFAAIEVKRSHSAAVPFARLKVKRKREIIAFRREAEPARARAPALAPERLATWIDTGRDDDGRRVVLLDTRNREEVAHGTFAGALALPIDDFVDLPAALESRRDAFADATVVSFCTGGIRCEKAALWMQANGFERVWQLDGGILGYFERVGGHGYDGACFVFDERVALDASLRPVAALPLSRED